MAWIILSVVATTSAPQWARLRWIRRQIGSRAHSEVERAIDFFQCPKQNKNMKIQSILVRFLGLVAVTLTVVTLQAHDEKKKIAGPNGGRIIAAIEPRAEFFVMPDRKVQITFLDKAGKAIPPAE